MPKASVVSKVETLALPKIVSDEVTGWRNQGYHPFPSETTRQLLAHWFDRDEEAGGRFHPCQRTAIETVIYLHEVRQVRSLKNLYEQFAPGQLALFKSIADEASAVPFLKYCVKSATGSGKTWVLAALVVWQYFNSINEETNAPYSSRFMIVTPGLEVRSRILDSFKGRRDPKTGNRDPADSDYRKPLFMPDDLHWRGRFHLLDSVLAPDDDRHYRPASRNRHPRRHVDAARQVFRLRLVSPHHLKGHRESGQDARALREAGGDRRVGGRLRLPAALSP